MRRAGSKILSLSILLAASFAWAQTPAVDAASDDQGSAKKAAAVKAAEESGFSNVSIGGKTDPGKVLVEGGVPASVAYANCPECRAHLQVALSAYTTAPKRSNENDDGGPAPADLRDGEK